MRDLERRAAEGDEDAQRRLLVERGRLVEAHPRIMEAWNGLPTVGEERAALKAIREGVPRQDRIQRFIGKAGRRWLRERAVRIVDMAYNGRWDEVLHQAHAMSMGVQTCPVCYGRKRHWVNVGEGELGFDQREERDCETCEATGKITPEDDDWAKFAKTCLAVLEEIGVDTSPPAE